MIYKIVMSDRSFSVLDEIQDLANNIQWEYSRIGGCGSFSFEIPSRFCRNLLISPGFNVKIYRRNPSTNAFDLWYQGRVESALPNVRGEDETLSVQGMGYQSQLQDIYLNGVSYSSTEISVIVKDILDNYITPVTNITYDVGDIEATTFTPDTIDFNCKAVDAFQTLADITGSREWGVDSDRKFFFKERSSTVGFRYPFGSRILNYMGDDSSRETINRVIVIGSGDPPFTATFNSSASQLKWLRRDKVIQNSAVTTNAVASQLADSVCAEFNDVVRRARVEILTETQIEETLPVPLLQVIPKTIKYGEMRYGEFLYSGLINYQINRVQYNLDDSGNLKLSIQLGQLRPSVAEDISQLEYQIDQLRGQNL